MSYTTIPGENTSTPVASVASAPTAPSRSKQVRRGALYACAGVLAALFLVSAHDRYTLTPQAMDMRRYPAGFPYVQQPGVPQPAAAMPPHVSLRSHPRAALMHEAAQRFAARPAAPLVPAMPVPAMPAAPAQADPRALRMHPRMTLMREAAARFAPRAAPAPEVAFGAPRPFPHPALYNRVESVAPVHAAHAPMVARGAMYDPRMMRGFGAVPPHMYFGQRAPLARGYAPIAPPMPMQAEPARAPVGAPHFVHRV